MPECTSDPARQRPDAIGEVRSRLRGVLPEAFELVEKGVLDPERFRDVTADNAIALHTRSPGLLHE